MIPFRNRLATGAFIAIVIGAFKVALDIVYKVLKLLKLQFLLSVLFVGAILFITKVLPENTTLLVIFLVFVAMGFFYFVVGNMQRIKKFFNKFKKEKKKAEPVLENTMQMQNVQIESQEIQARPYIDNNNSQIIEEPIREEKYPRYYRVSQNKNYVMAEYKDRYELYVKKNGSLFRVRTDIKKEFR